MTMLEEAAREQAERDRQEAIHLRNKENRLVADAAREYVVAFDALQENAQASDWLQYRVRHDHAQRLLWAACGRVEGWPESEPENA